MSSPRKRHRKPTTQQPQPAPNVAKRIHVSLEEDKPIGLELDFSAEATTGVRVSHVNAGGAAESEGVEQEDRLIHVSGQDVREMGLVETREMLLRRAKTTLLVFERPLPPSPPPSPPRPRKNMDTKNARREKNRRKKRFAGGGGGNGDFSSDAQPNVSPVVAATAAEAGTTWQRRSTAPAAAQRRRGYQQHRLYNSGGGDGGSGSGEEAPSTAEAAAALAALAGRGSSGAKAAQRAAQKRRRRKAATATAAVTPTAVDTDPKPPQAVQGILEQLDSLAAQQQQQQQRQQQRRRRRRERQVPVPPPPRRSPLRPPPQKAVGEAATAAEIETIHRQLEEEEDHEREMEGHRRQRAQQQPPPQQKMRQRRLAAEEARNGVGVGAPEGTGAEDRSETEEVEAQVPRGAAAAVDTPPTTAAAAAATASPPPPSQRHGKREGSRKPGNRSRHGEEEKMAKTAARPQPRRPEDSGEGERNGSGMTTIIASPRSGMPRAAAAAPAWLGVLVGLGMPDFAGTGAARASVVVREARDMEAKELAVLQRLQKLKPGVTLDDYTAFRGAGLRSSSPAYASLEALQGKYLRRPPEDHQQELADLAMDGSFVSDLLAGGDESTIGTTPTTTTATPPSSSSPSPGPLVEMAEASTPPACAAAEATGGYSKRGCRPDVAAAAAASKPPLPSSSSSSAPRLPHGDDVTEAGAPPGCAAAEAGEGNRSDGDDKSGISTSSSISSSSSSGGDGGGTSSGTSSSGTSNSGTSNSGTSSSGSGSSSASNASSSSSSSSSSSDSSSSGSDSSSSGSDSSSDSGRGSGSSGSSSRNANGTSINGNGDGSGSGDGKPLPRRRRQQQQQQQSSSGEMLSERHVQIARAQLKRAAERVKFIEESRGALQDVVRRSSASRERATAITDSHRAVRRQSLHDVKETREAGKKTEKEAREVLAKIRLWEKAARVSEELAFEEADAVARRAETLGDAVELLAGWMERQNSHMERLAVFRMLNGPLAAAAAASDQETIQ